MDLPMHPASLLGQSLEPRASRRALAHIPGEDGFPVIGKTLELIADPKGFVEFMDAGMGRYSVSVRWGIFPLPCWGPMPTNSSCSTRKKFYPPRRGGASCSAGFSPAV